MNKRIVYFILICIGVLFLSGCTNGQDEEPTQRMTLSTPTNVRIEGDILLWDDVEEAEEYFVSFRTLTGTIAAKVSTNSFDLSTAPSNYLQEIKVRSVHSYHFNSPYSNSFQYSRPLDTPVLKDEILNGVIGWNIVRNAHSYLVVFYEEEEVLLEIETTTLSVNGFKLNKEGTFQVAVRALGEVDQISSGFSAPIHFTMLRNQVVLEIPTCIRIEDSSLVWTPVEEATGYEIRLTHSGLRTTYTSTKTNFDLSILGKDTYQISIRAIGEGGIQASAFSNPRAYVVSVSRPSAITLIENQLHWNHDNAATSHIIYLNDEEYMVNNPPFTLPILPVGEYSVRILSKSQTLRSNFSEKFSFIVSLPYPTQITEEDNVLYWENVVDAARYRVIIESELLEQIVVFVETNSYNLLSLGLPNGIYSIRVQSLYLEEENSIFDSALSDSIQITIP